jgi:hypothetical protein
MATAAIRYKNPGAMWGSSLAIKWGAQKAPVSLNDGTGQGNNIAVFPTYVQGAAAQFDLWQRSYSNMSLQAATTKWSGGNSDKNYVDYLCQQVGITPQTIITKEFLAGPKGITMMRAQARWESGTTKAGQDYPLTMADWKKAQDMVFKGTNIGPSKPINVAPPKASFDKNVEAAQNLLLSFGYFEVGTVDGLWGAKTLGALGMFIGDRHANLTVHESDGTVQPVVLAELQVAASEKWHRPIAESRATATPADIAPKNVAVHQSIWQGFIAKITGWGSASAATVTAAANVFPAVNEKVSPVKEFFTNVPGWVWFSGMAIIAVIVVASANRIKNATTADYNVGKIN